MEGIAVFKMLADGANFAAIAALWLVWRIDRRIGHIEDWVKHHENTTDLRIKMIEKDLNRGLEAMRQRLEEKDK